MCADIPTEVYQEIFKYACTDDGATGRSLSLVSRHFWASSRPFKLQSLSVVGEHQLHSFAHHLNTLPLNARRVRHLCISLVLELPRTCKNLHEGMNGFWEHEADTSMLLILQSISSSLTTLHLISNLRRASVLPPIPLPLLQTLAIHGPMRSGSRCEGSLPMFPALRRLSLRRCQEYPTATLQQISQQAPSLRSLSFSLDRPLPDLSRDFVRALEHRSCDPAQGIPPSLTRIRVRHFNGSVVEKNTWLRSAQKVMLKELSGIIEKDERVVVAEMYHLVDYHEARLRWLEEVFQ